MVITALDHLVSGVAVTTGTRDPLVKAPKVVLTVEVENMVHSGQMSPASLRIWLIFILVASHSAAN